MYQVRERDLNAWPIKQVRHWMKHRVLKLTIRICIRRNRQKFAVCRRIYCEKSRNERSIDFPKSIPSREAARARGSLLSSSRAYPLRVFDRRRYIKHVAGILALKWSYFFRCLLKISPGNKPRTPGAFSGKAKDRRLSSSFFVPVFSLSSRTFVFRLF